jgi:orotidine-5'-phosphate decarboxylase
MRFTDKLQRAQIAQSSLLCVGLDPEPTKFPAHMKGNPKQIAAFCKVMVDATAEFACAFKPQIAYFHAYRAEDQLEEVLSYIREHAPTIPVVLDAKRGDIGATAEQYAREAFERYQADALTVSPYMGFDSMEPYLRYPDKGLFLLCRTSNPGGSDLQFLDIGERKLYEEVARLAAGAWREKSSQALGLVVGATYPEEVARVRAIASDSPLLIPGIGAQGGDLRATVRAGRDASGRGMLINSSRAILYASAEADFAQAAAREARRTRDEINAVLEDGT